MVALTGAALADGVASRNVVGYQTLDKNEVSQMIGATFRDIATGADSIRLGDLVGDFESYDEIQIPYMDGRFIEFVAYQYLTEDDGVDADGWYDGSWESADDVTLARGQAAWFVSATAKPVITSGEVVAGTTTHPAFTEASSMICSAYPIPFNPNAETVTWTGLNSYDEIQVSYMDGRFIEFISYQWLTEDDGVDVDGWYDGSWDLVTEPIVDAGQGFWLILSDCENVTLTEASPLAASAQ